jgi:hypothetical protein
MARKFVGVAACRHYGKLDKLPVMLFGVALEQSPFEELSPKNQAKKITWLDFCR